MTTNTITGAARTEAWDGTDLDQPSRWHKPRLIVITTDLFDDDHDDKDIWSAFDVMEWAERHTFYVPTSHYARMARFVQRRMDALREYAAKFDDCPTEAMRNSPAAKWARERAAAPPPAHIRIHASVRYDQASGDVVPELGPAGAR
ncbi:DUF5131 family protein [Nonomuraea bangladeshensis]|uniref:DUF5131 family protein n=1 Tax=Nonomuraea bangladeshensis TaxID=404385 RepID=A0ABV3H4N4_9ACTN